MALAVWRDDLKRLTHIRVEEAAALLSANQPSGASYLVGYAIECALKACIAAQFREHQLPDKKLVNDSYTHDLRKLIGLAGLRQNFDTHYRSSSDFQVNWTVVEQWSEGRRYQIAGLRDAQDMYDAVTTEPDGVLAWVKRHW